MSALPSTAAQELADQLGQLDRPKKWRLVLGRSSEEALGTGLGGGPGGKGGSHDHLFELDQTLGALYDEGEPEKDRASRSAGLGQSSPRLARWIGDVRKFFPKDVVQVVQQDAIERKGLKQLLFEPEMLEQVEPSVELAATLLTYKGMIPEQTKDTAREVVRKVAEEIIQRMRSSLERSIRGALNRQQHAPLPRLANLDVRRTVRRNLKNYDRERKALIVDRTWFYARQHRQFEWNVVVCLDQSGSMAPSIVYGAVVASILASLPSLRTHLVAFDTQVVDYSDQCSDPVDVLFGIQLGGGTDINRAVGYCQGLIADPRKTIFLLISDMCEGGNASELVVKLEGMVASGVKCAALLALNDDGAPAYDHGMAQKISSFGMPAFACTPARLPELLEAAIRGDELRKFESRPK